MKVLRFTFYALTSIAAAMCVTWAFGALYFDFSKAGPKGCRKEISGPIKSDAVSLSGPRLLFDVDLPHPFLLANDLDLIS